VNDAAMYDAFAEEYARHAATGTYNALYDRPAVLELCGDVSGRRVLDAACGPGLYARALKERGAHVVGFDNSAPLIELARQRLGGGVELRVHDLADPLHWLEAASVDLVVLALAINYVDDRVTLLRDLRRVLRPAGALVISTTHPMADWLRLGGSYFEQAPVESSLDPDHDWPVRAWRRPLTSICEEYREAGFVIERLIEPLPSPEMASRDPEAFDRLRQAPAFVAFRLRPAA
jgi:SAM-dependent methyltransferase